MSVRVLVVDDHPVFRDGLAALLGALPDTQVVGLAANGAEAVELAARLEPDVVIMDVQMPVLGGVEATRRITTERPATAVLVVTMGEDDSTVLAALRAGARGYLLKGAEADEVVRAITTVHGGGLVFGASVAAAVTTLLSGSGSGPPRAFPQLTEREREVLDLVAAGRSNPQIAARLYLSPKTVRNHVSAILAKLQADDRSSMIVRAREAGFGG